MGEKPTNLAQARRRARQDAEQALKRALKGNGVVVLRMPPGLGKTTSIQNALKRFATGLASGQNEKAGVFSQLQEAGVRRVLWATRETVADDSLGAEAECAFLECCRIRVERVLGLEALERSGHGEGKARWMRNRRAQWQQLVSPQTVEIKIISHAHLPLIFGSPRVIGPLRDLRQADLLIIDEDPGAALMLRSTLVARKDKPPVPNSELPSHSSLALSAQDFARLLHDSGISAVPAQALLAQWQVAFDHPELQTRYGTRSRQPPHQEGQDAGLHGEAFWHLMRSCQREGACWETLARQLGEKWGDRAHARQVAQAFKDDLAAFDDKQITMRFGFYQSTHSPLMLRFNLLQPLHLWHRKRGSREKIHLPTLVLDAYACEPYYSRLFAPVEQAEHKGSALEFFCSAVQLPPLQVAVDSNLFVSRNSAERGVSRRRHRLVAALATQYVNLKWSHPQTTLLLSYLNVVDEPEWKEFLQWARQLFPFRSSVTPHRRPVKKAQGTSRGGDQIPRFDLKTLHWFSGRGLNRYEGAHVIALTPPKLPRTYRDYELAALYPLVSESEKRKVLHDQLECAELLQMLNRGRQSIRRLGGKPTPYIILGFPLPKHPLLNSEIETVPLPKPLYPSDLLKERSSNMLLRFLLWRVAYELDALDGLPLAVWGRLGLLKAYPEDHPEVRLIQRRLQEKIVKSRPVVTELWQRRGARSIMEPLQRKHVKRRSSLWEATQGIVWVQPGGIHSNVIQEKVQDILGWQIFTVRGLKIYAKNNDAAEDAAAEFLPRLRTKTGRKPKIVNTL